MTYQLVIYLAGFVSGLFIGIGVANEIWLKDPRINGVHKAPKRR